MWPGFTLGARNMLETSLPHPQASLLGWILGRQPAQESTLTRVPDRVRAKALGLDSSSFPCSGLKSPWSFSDPHRVTVRGCLKLSTTPEAPLE